MKRIILAVVFGVASLSSISTKAQVSLSINIGSQPQWGPTGYDHVDYYYLPDVDAYYYVPTSQYIYLSNNSWVWRNSLPARYSNYNLYSGYKVVMNTPKPYLSHQTHIREYSRYKNYGSKQSMIRDSRDTRYVSARSKGGAQNNRPRVQQQPTRSDNRQQGRENDNRNNGNRGNNDHKNGNDHKGNESRGRG